MQEFRKNKMSMSVCIPGNYEKSMSTREKRIKGVNVQKLHEALTIQSILKNLIAYRKKFKRFNSQFIIRT